MNLELRYTYFDSDRNQALFISEISPKLSSLYFIYTVIQCSKFELITTETEKVMFNHTCFLAVPLFLIRYTGRRVVGNDINEFELICVAFEKTYLSLNLTKVSKVSRGCVWSV